MELTHFRIMCLPNTPADRPWQISAYGETLRVNKGKLWAAFETERVPSHLRSLFLAMAFLETRTLSLSERDASKDGRTDGAANVSIFNLSVDMVGRLGYTRDVRSLNGEGALHDVVALLVRGVREWGVDRLLNYVRGGWTAFQDGVSYGADAYRRTIATLMYVIDTAPDLMHDGRRAEVHLEHV